MKSIKVFVVSFCLIAVVNSQAEDTQPRSYGGGGGGGPAVAAKPAPSSYSAPPPAPASYSGSAPISFPAIPCPKSYLFSCQPSLTPAPCAPPVASAGHGGAGAYSQEYPIYTLPQFYNGYQSYY